MSDFDPDALRSELQKSFGTSEAPQEKSEISHSDIFSALAKDAADRKAKELKTSSGILKQFQDPSLWPYSAPLAIGTGLAQYAAPPREAQLAAAQLQREARAAVRSGNVAPSGLTSIQRYAGSQQNIIPPQNVNPALATTSNVQTQLVKPLTEGTERLMEYAPGAKPVPGSETGLVHEGTWRSAQQVEGTPAATKAKVNVPAVSAGSKTAERLAEMMEGMSPTQRKAIESMLQRGYAIPDVFKKILGRVAVPAAVASIPQEASAAYEAYRKGDYPRMVTSGLGALGGTALGVGAGLGAFALAPEIAAALALGGGTAALAPVGQAVYDYFNPPKP